MRNLSSRSITCPAAAEDNLAGLALFAIGGAFRANGADGGTVRPPVRRINAQGVHEFRGPAERRTGQEKKPTKLPAARLH